MMTEFEKMINGEHFNSLDLDLRLKREAARLACAKYNAHPSKGNLRHITRLFAQSELVVIEPGFQCDYGSQIYLGKGVYINFQCVLLDSAPIHIGDQVLIGPAAHLYTVDHPRDAAARASGECFARPIHIGNRVWIGGGAKVLPGMTIGDDAIIAANAVVTRNVAQGERYLG
ncbi:sugar O-acetyltransferase [Marinomonas posidonica]|uniref:Maltose O-acetyltransferase n=1 Tax=Marinomonas posidonica (strain CECT 7376 / NCIMB 14433 / IVIA-Po-181) TaxID=491952 RepID=F6CYG8_MARPP|nr:sugar O-acetyltransferase [Marinomonas posidonica]AEF54577.1 Maltose O-acetyltransferase [Marinomonas posidonica IVIA-Po-181]